MRQILSLLVALVLVALLPAEAQAFRYTHRLSVTAELTDNWTVRDTGECGINGGGTVKLTLTSNGLSRFRPIYDKKAARRVGVARGSLILGVPVGSGVGAMTSRRSNGTLETSDESLAAPVADDPEIFCEDPDTSGCGKFDVVDARITIVGADPTHLYSNVAMPFGAFAGASTCQIGMLQDWSNPHAGEVVPDPFSELTLGPTSLRSLKSHRARELTSTTHETTRTELSDESSVTDEITRTITVKISKL